MATIEQARADRARDVLNRTIEQQQLTQQESQSADVRSENARADVARIVVKGDGIEGKDASKTARGQLVASSDVGIAHTASGTNPFATLVAGETTQPTTSTLLLAEALPLGTELAPDVEQMLSLGVLEASSLKQSESGLRTAADKVRTGTLLLLSDDGAAAREKLGDTHDSANELAGHLIENAAGEEAEQSVSTIVSEHVMTTSMPQGVDINAYVQQVLRESYVLQQGVLKDYADEMTAINDQRKEYRAQLKKQREAKTKVANGEKLTAEELETVGLYLTDDDLASLEESDADSEDTTTDTDASDTDVDSSSSTDEDGAADTSTAPEWDVSMAEGFAQVLPVDVSGSNGVLSSKATWTDDDDDGDRYKQLRKDPATLKTAIDQVGATWSVKDLADVMNTALYGIKKGDHTDENHDLIQSVIDDMSYDQLTELKETDPKLWRRIDIELGGACEARLKQFSDARSAGLSVEPAGGPADKAVNLFALAQAHDFQSPWKEQALAAMHDLSSTDAIAALKTIATCSSPKVSTDVFDEFFFACDPSKLLKNNTDHTSLDFVKDVGGTASKNAVDRWNGVETTDDTTEIIKAAFATVGRGQQTNDLSTTENTRLTTSTSIRPSREAATTSSVQSTSDGTSDSSATTYGSSAPADATDRSIAEIDEVLTSTSDEQYETLIGDKLDDIIATTQDDLDSAGGDAELMQLTLQDAMQKSQELMQMMSNMSKVIHDTIMSVVRNIGG